jgi:Domain of unknown function (DUF4159)
MKHRGSIVSLLALMIAAAASVSAQRRGGWFRDPVDIPIDPAPQYDGRFTFARLKFTTGPGGYYFRGLPAWAHGYVDPEGKRAEANLAKILQAVTNMNLHVDGTRVVDVSDPDLFQYPVVYATEPGYMQLDEKDVQSLRAYLQKGGFIIFDDFRGYDWESFRTMMERVLPGEHLMQLSLTDPIFHSFFDIQTLEFHQYYDRGTPLFYGMFPNNDPKKPMQVIANFNNDVSEYWEYSDSGFTPIDLSNEAYKLGVNYIVYGMTH